MAEQATIHGELCLEPALGCGPCQLLKGHEHPRHLCDHYAKGGNELHDPNDRGCRCWDCERDRLAHTMDLAYDALVKAQRRADDAKKAYMAHMHRPLGRTAGGGR